MVAECLRLPRGLPGDSRPPSQLQCLLPGLGWTARQSGGDDHDQPASPDYHCDKVQAHFLTRNGIGGSIKCLNTNDRIFNNMIVIMS